MFDGGFCDCRCSSYGLMRMNATCTSRRGCKSLVTQRPLMNHIGGWRGVAFAQCIMRKVEESDLFSFIRVMFVHRRIYIYIHVLHVYISMIVSFSACWQQLPNQSSPMMK